MKKILGARATGKTYKLIQMSAETGAVIVCPDQSRKNYILFLAQKSEETKTIPVPMTLQDILDDKYRGRAQHRGFLIDDADVLLQYLCGYEKVLAITMQSEYVEQLSIPDMVRQKIDGYFLEDLQETKTESDDEL